MWRCHELTEYRRHSCRYGGPANRLYSRRLEDRRYGFAVLCARIILAVSVPRSAELVTEAGSNSSSCHSTRNRKKPREEGAGAMGGMSRTR